MEQQKSHLKSMAESADSQPQGNPLAIVSKEFCVPNIVDLTIKSQLLGLTRGDFTVKDVYGNVMFNIKGKFFTIHGHHTLRDAAGNAMLTFRHKILTTHKRWEVFRGESKDEKDLLFTAKKSSLIQFFKTELDVFLPGNCTDEKVCDFKVKGSARERSCSIHLGDTPTIIAQMYTKSHIPLPVIGGDNFSVTVYPNVDYVFIVALVVVLEEIHQDQGSHKLPLLSV